MQDNKSKCWGVTAKGRRCKLDRTWWLFCGHHRRWLCILLGAVVLGTIALVGNVSSIYSVLFTKETDPETKANVAETRVLIRLKDIVTARHKLQEETNRARRQSQQLALGIAETRRQALAVASEDPTVKMLAAKLRKTLDEFKEQPDLQDLSEIDDLQLRLTEATLANAERQYAKSLTLVTEDDALSGQLVTEAQIEREVSVQGVRRYAFFGQGRWAKALECFDRIHQLRPGEQLVTEAQIEREVSVQGVRGYAFFGQGRWAKALECFDRIHQLRPDDIHALNSLGGCNWYLARYTTARKQFLQCIEKQEETTGRDSVCTVPFYFNMAMVERDLGKPSEARTLLQKATAIAEKAYDPDHLMLALYYSNLALFELGSGDPTTANEWLTKAISIAEKSLPKDYPERIRIGHYGLGKVQFALGNRERGIDLVNEAHSFFLERLGMDNVHTRASASWLEQHASEVPAVAK